MLEIYLPIADLKVNFLILISLGLLTGVLSGMFGVGGGIIAVPVLTFLGISPQIAVATATNQMIAGTITSFSAYSKHNRVDYELGTYLLIGGFIGNVLGFLLLLLLSKFGHVDIVISLGFIILLSIVGYTTIKDAIKGFYYKSKKIERPHKKPLFYKSISKLPFQHKFVSSQYSTSNIIVCGLGIAGGMLVILLGIGGAFVMIPAMLHILKVEEKYATGTMLFQLMFTSITATMIHAVEFHGVDVVLSLILIIGTVIGSVIGSKIGLKIDKENFRIILGIIILILCIRVGYDVVHEPENIYKIVRVLK